jgi:hypothetical protein
MGQSSGLGRGEPIRSGNNGRSCQIAALTYIKGVSLFAVPILHGIVGRRGHDSEDSRMRRWLAIAAGLVAFTAFGAAAQTGVLRPERERDQAEFRALQDKFEQILRERGTATDAARNVQGVLLRNDAERTRQEQIERLRDANRGASMNPAGPSPDPFAQMQRDDAGRRDQTNYDQARREADRAAWEARNANERAERARDDAERAIKAGVGRRF